MKKCERCENKLPFSAFHKVENKDGLSAWCMECHAEYHKKRREGDSMAEAAKYKP